MPELERLCSAFQLADVQVTPERIRVSRLEGLAIVCHRLAFPSREIDLQRIYGRDRTSISQIISHMIKLLSTRFRELLYFDHARIAPLLPLFAAAIHSSGAPMTTVWGFIDGTARPIARPRLNQRLFYSGHKRFHCLKYHAVTTPDGMVVHLFGPVAGRHHDLFVLRESGLQEAIAQDDRFAPYVLYGDPGYLSTNQISCPFKGSNIDAAQQEFNRLMSSARVSVEWAFGIISGCWQHISFKRHQKSLLTAVAAQYQVAVLLTNCKTCLHGNEISMHFQLQPPTLEQYFHS